MTNCLVMMMVWSILSVGMTGCTSGLDSRAWCKAKENDMECQSTRCSEAQTKAVLALRPKTPSNHFSQCDVSLHHLPTW